LSPSTVRLPLTMSGQGIDGTYLHERPILLHMLKLDVSDDTTHVVVLMFNEIATALVKCSADSLMDAMDEINPSDGVKDSVGSSTLDAVADNQPLDVEDSDTENSGDLANGTRKNKDPRLSDRKKKNRVEFDYSDVDVSCGSGRVGTKGTAATHSAKEKRKRLAFGMAFITTLTVILNQGISNSHPVECSLIDRTVNLTLSNMINKDVFLTSNTIIGQDEKVHNYCGLRLVDIPASSASVLAVYHNLGPPSYECSKCNATMWYNERSDKARKAVTPTFSLCCQEGKVLLLRFNDTYQPLKKLLDYNDTTTSRFKDQIRVYNSMFCFTSFGARIDHSVNSGRGPYTFRINGQNYHRMGSLLIAEGVALKYAQLYFFDIQNEIRNMMSAFMSKETPETIDKNIVASLIQILDHTSAMAKSFRMAKEWCHSHSDVNFGLRLLSKRTTTRQYNTPTVFEVAALIINYFGDGLPTRDIVVNKNNTDLQCISELHPSYMALQYPLSFSFGEDGYHEKIPYHSNRGNQKTKRRYVTMKEYYAYIIQQQKNQGTTLLREGRLFQQYLVDAFTAIEEQWLNWIRNNQDTLRVDLYHNICDAVTRGDTSAAGLRKRIVFALDFYRQSKIHDAKLSRCNGSRQAYGNPDLFITFTSNLKWPEIAEMLACLPGQKSHDRPEVMHITS
ncbi:ATP-dependent DNA helicase PIF1, partial [Tanacetum coccineum]